MSERYITVRNATLFIGHSHLYRYNGRQLEVLAQAHCMSILLLSVIPAGNPMKVRVMMSAK
jgi:hypothetical protein